ncbi:alpha/beta hydrolase family protein [Amycolatopsis sp. lyj-108]|uniref:alpha/beta hydrolase family protein n=1 Tax=Amycolatopsis sp. lyj-108 TaxID=2789286 RepID=UPI00397DAE18
MARRGLTLLALFTVFLGLVIPGASAAGPVTRYEGELEGARYLVLVPDNWNGTLMLWSHGMYSLEYPEPERIALTSQPTTESYLLEQGYALAASQYRTVRGWSIEEALTDQIRLHDWFARTVGPPRRTIAAGESIGAITATLLAERNPRRFAGLMTFCGNLAGGAAHWNSGLDLGYALNTLLDAQLELVRITDPAANAGKFINVVQAATANPQGQARLALANALAEIPGWFDATRPRPPDVAEQVFWQGVWDRFYRASAFGVDRVALEQRAGGNPSWNVGVDYRRVLAKAGERPLVERAYAEAGLDLGADLDKLAKAPRISPDPAAAGYLARFGLPLGRTPFPVLTTHTVADGTAPAAHERAYAERVAVAGDPGNLRQLFVNRAGHCVFTASEEITALRTLERRLDRGHWPSSGPAALNAEAAGLAPEHQTIFDAVGEARVTTTPAFARHSPPPYPRVLPF